MNSLRQKISDNFDNLQAAIEQQHHLDEAYIEDVLVMFEACSKYWRVLDDEHRDFLNAVRFAIEEGVPWQSPCII